SFPTRCVMSDERLRTIDEAARLLGISRRKIIGLICDGTLTWTLGMDKRFIMVEIPPEMVPDRRETSPTESADDGRGPGPSIPSEAATPCARRPSHPLTISEIDAWSQPK